MLRSIFRFFSLIFIAGIFFGLTHGACTPDGQGGYNGGSMTPPSSSQCSFGTDPNSIQWYDNNQSLSENAKKFIVAYQLGNTFNLNCDSNYVANIQSQMQIIGGSCATCEDGKFGKDTKNKLNNSCLPTCVDPNKPVNADLQNPCDVNYTLENGCCIPPDCSGNGKTPQNAQGGCDSGLTGDGAGCCIEQKFCNNVFTESQRTSRNISDKFDKDKCCRKISEKPTQPPELSFQPFCDGITSCANPLKPLSGGICPYGSGWGQDGACCKQFCTNFPTGTPPTCSEGFNVGSTGGINDCCLPVTNNCTGKQYGEWTGQSYVCKDCGSGKVANSGNTKCVCDSSQGCCGIKLNTVVPFIGDCIELSSDESSANTTRVTPLNAFPKLMGSLSKILITAILIFSFVMVVVGGVLVIAGGIKQENYTKGIDMIKKVIIALALLGASGIILHLINPSFFG